MTNVENSAISAAGRRVLNVNAVFATLLPEPTDVELDRLRESLIADGVRDPLVAWNGTIVDGHHRYVIANELGLNYRVIDMEFESDDRAREWIILTQIGRRNLTPSQKSMASDEMDRIRQNDAHDRMLAGVKSLDSERNVHAIARTLGIGASTVQRALYVTQNAPELIPVIRSGKLDVFNADKIIRTPDPELRAELIAAELSDDGALAHKLNAEKRRADAAQQKLDDEIRLAAAADHAATLAKHPEFKPTPEYVPPVETPSPGYTALTEKISLANIHYIEHLVNVLHLPTDADTGTAISRKKPPALTVLDAVISDLIRMRTDVEKTDFMAYIESANQPKHPAFI